MCVRERESKKEREMEGRAREVAEIKSAGNLIGESASKTPFDKNENCNEHGYCIDNSTVPSCICIKGFEGEKCEITSQELIKAKTVKKSSVIIAIACVVVFI